MTDKEFRLAFTRAVAEDDFPLCDEDGELTNEGLDRMTDIACAIAEGMFEREEVTKECGQ